MKRALSLLLVFTLILSSALIFASCKDDKKEGEGFDFTKEKMKNYITLNREDYIGIEVEAEIDPDQLPEITEEFIEDYLNRNVAQLVANGKIEGKELSKDRAVEDGDIVFIYFRGSIDGVAFEGGSNYSNSSPAGLVIGSGSSIPGFEEALIGIVPNETSFVNIDSGKIEADHIAYVSYSYTYTDESGKDQSGEVKEKRIDLANPNEKDALFVEHIVGQTVGGTFKFDAEYDVKDNGDIENVSFTMKVNYATIEKTVAIEVTFPDDYGEESLNGKAAIFDVAILKNVEKPALTADIVTTNFGYKSENGAKDEALLAEYRKALKDSFTAQRNSLVEQIALENLLPMLYDKAEVKKYPEEALEDAIAYYKTALTETFNQYSQKYSDFPYETEEEFAPDFFGSDYDKTYNLEANIEKITKREILMNMVDNYLIQEEKIKYESDKEREDTVKSLIESFIYNYYYTYGQQVTEEQVLEAYGEEYFAQAGLFNKLSEFLLENVTVKEVIIEENETEAE